MRSSQSNSTAQFSFESLFQCLQSNCIICSRMFRCNEWRYSLVNKQKTHAFRYSTCCLVRARNSLSISVKWVHYPMWKFIFWNIYVLDFCFQMNERQTGNNYQLLIMFSIWPPVKERKDLGSIDRNRFPTLSPCIFLATVTTVPGYDQFNWEPIVVVLPIFVSSITTA